MATKKAAAKKKSSTKTNKLGVKNSLVNNINARKEKGVSKPKSKSTISKNLIRKWKKAGKRINNISIEFIALHFK